MFDLASRLHNTAKCPFRVGDVEIALCIPLFQITPALSHLRLDSDRSKVSVS